MLDETLDLNKGTPTAPQGRSSHFASRQAQEERARSLRFSSSEPSTSAGKGSSLQDLLAAFPTEQSRSRAPGSTFGNKMNTDDLQQPSAYPDLTGFTGGQGYQARPVPLPVRLGPNLGRTVKVNPTRNIDVGRAFRQLDILCTRNRVRTDFNRQRFHERPGLRRKRLKRERWRKHFKEGFKGMVALVKKMKKQGW
ncbi:Ribosomal protein S21-like protein [Elsinoe fawcettii]|nr:Ribosomal protein S21-like protein [Elsinoe fawcettii]